MKIIPTYIDWTDAVAHLNYSDTYAEGETEDQKLLYTTQVGDEFFAACERLKKLGYRVDAHVISGGTIDYLQKWNEENVGLAIKSGQPNLFKSLTTEYGGDVITVDEKENGEFESVFIPHPYDGINFATSDVLQERLKALVPAKYAPEFINYKYGQNIRLENPDITEDDFEAVAEMLKSIDGAQELDIYPYYCPGYGVEVDFFPKGFDKERAVENVNGLFYSDVEKEQIALSIFNGDFADVDLRMVNQSLTNNVLFVGTQDGNIKEHTEGTTLEATTEGRKLNAVTMALNNVADVIERTGDVPNYDKGSYKAKV